MYNKLPLHGVRTAANRRSIIDNRHQSVFRLSDTRSRIAAQTRVEWSGKRADVLIASGLVCESCNWKC